MSKRLTLKQIASDLKVSISTVSKALKDSYEISVKTKDKIRAYADKNHYVPNKAALSLKGKKTKNIAVIIPDIVHEFFAKVISGIENYTDKLGYRLIICVSNNSYEKEVLNIGLLANNSVDGFIISLSKGTQCLNNDEHIRRVVEEGIPVVMFDRVDHELSCDKVVFDDMAGGYLAARHLIKKGCLKLGLITTPDYVSVGSQRTKGFLQAINEAKGMIFDNQVLKIDNIEDSHIEIKNFLKMGFDGIVSVNELYAVTAMDIHKNMGFNIPSDCKYVGFSNGILSKYCSPKLTVIGQQAYKMGMEAAELLINQLESKRPKPNYETRVITPRLIQRESSST